MTMLPDTFSRCLEFTLKSENGKSDDPLDPGGRTNQGVTQRTYDYWRGMRGLEKQDVYAMSNDERNAIYREEYWEPCHCFSLPPPAALCVFDMAVNSGCKASLECLQKSCGVPVDGEWGPLTFKAARANAVKELIQNFAINREIHYRKQTNFPHDGDGWLARNEACKALALSWCH